MTFQWFTGKFFTTKLEEKIRITYEPIVDRPKEDFFNLLTIIIYIIFHSFSVSLYNMVRLV